jgi:hypothetical protein
MGTVQGFAGQKICALEAPLKMTSTMAVFLKNCMKRKGNLACLTPHHGSCLFHTTVHLPCHSCWQWPFSEAPCSVLKFWEVCGAELTENFRKLIAFLKFA